MSIDLLAVAVQRPMHDECVRVNVCSFEVRKRFYTLEANARKFPCCILEGVQV